MVWVGGGGSRNAVRLVVREERDAMRRGLARKVSSYCSLRFPCLPLPAHIVSRLHIYTILMPYYSLRRPDHYDIISKQVLSGK